MVLKAFLARVAGSFLGSIIAALLICLILGPTPFAFILIKVGAAFGIAVADTSDKCFPLNEWRRLRSEKRDQKDARP